MLSKALSIVAAALAAVIVSTLALISGFHQGLDPKSVVITIALLGLMAFLWRLLNGWVSTATRPGSTQTVTLRTTETPSQIVWAAIRATLILFCLCVMMVAALVGLLHFLSSQGV